MHVAVLPASPKTARAAIRHLLADPDGPTVQAVYRDPSKAPRAFSDNPRFRAVPGSLAAGDVPDLSSADAVLVVTPPALDDGGGDMVARARAMAEAVRDAVARAGSVRRVVLLSSMGAQYGEEGVGEIQTNYAAEQVLRDAAPEVVFVRAAYFMENWATALETLSGGDDPFFVSTITPLDFPVPMIAVEDIGKTLAAQLRATGQPLRARPHVFDLVGGSFSTRDVQQAFEAALGRQVAVRAVDGDGLDGFYAQLFPPATARAFAEMNRSFLPGGIIARDPRPTGETKTGAVGLVEALRALVRGD